MSKMIQDAIKLKRKYLINQLLQLGTYKKDDQHLYELTLSQLEEEIKAIDEQKV
ncbi:Fur-regulated basic protein FbpA [Evansella sp. AB-P1]|uniref:Fur-regulated basic protein FbpA n=1 Tax=Evansella sp. AB-P1 TaxID=3037653 RepID=UPI00241C53E4|nr:Fur-regulated basic protein FbpA [Evansella sp. AB-P1]MDG5786130.1 Fur-regulated basic protein FbpA [Evansella sp. AB-P1]